MTHTTMRASRNWEWRELHADTYNIAADITQVCGHMHRSRHDSYYYACFQDQGMARTACGHIYSSRLNSSMRTHIQQQT